MIWAVVAAVVYTATDVQAIRAKCQTPGSWLTVRRNGGLRIKPARTADYRKVDCVLGALRTIAEQQGYHVGFLGNEAPRPEKPE